MLILKYFQKLVCLIVLLLLVSCVNTASSVPTAVPTASQTTAPHQVFQPILSVLKERTRVPLLLPSYIPPGLPNDSGKLRKLYAVIDKATPFEYSIILGTDKQCTGGTYCRWGYVTGKVITPITLRLDEEYEYDPGYYPLRSKERPGFVTLKNRAKAYFLPYTCGANCSDSYLAWDQDGYRYSVSILASELRTLIKMANSAIPN